MSMEFITEYSQLIDIGLNLLIIGVGLSAIIIYNLQKKDDIQATAMIIKIQVDSIEENIKELKNLEQKRQDRATIYNIPEILPINLWDEHKNKLAKYIPSYDFELLDDFYNSAYRIHTAKVDIDNTLRTQWDCKIYITQKLVSRKVSGDNTINNDIINKFC